MTEVGQMNPDLVRPSGAGNCPNDCKFSFWFRLPNESIFNPELGDRSRSGAMNHLLEPDRGKLMRPLPRNRSINNCLIPLRPAADNREVLLSNLMPLHCLA